ncbi:MAG: hypothetical protein L6R40_004981 [Gallowayella cf. fulva]|nr:MAG: hypothetical protein L6R40_004981 [Xanthomendoza cf. fulva]
MSDNEARAQIVSDLYMTSEFPSVNELDDATCYICYKSLRGGTELPIKLSCGHVFGMTCILTWTLNKREVGKAANCPICRTSYSADMPDSEVEESEPADEETETTDEESEATETEDLSPLLDALADDMPGTDFRLDEEEERWVARAEELWEDLCYDILYSLDHPDLSEGCYIAVPRFIYREVSQAERILSFGTVYNFFQAYIGYGLEDGDGPEGLPASYRPLTRHLDSFQTTFEGQDGDEGGIGRWRVYQALLYRTERLTGQIQRMHRSQQALLNRIQQSGSSRPL